jgi:hypothetical protein
VDELDRLAAVQAARNGRPGGEYAVTFDEKGKLKLPPKAEHDDVGGHCSWLTGVFSLDQNHPITGGKRHGLHGPEGHVELTRAGAPSIHLEGIGKMANATRLRETLEGHMLDTDGELPGFRNEHTYAVLHVLRMLCGATELLSIRAETTGLVGDFLADAEPIEGHTTHGNSGQRYEAVVALRRNLDDCRATWSIATRANTWSESATCPQWRDDDTAA